MHYHTQSAAAASTPAHLPPLPQPLAPADITDLSSWIVVPAYDVAIFYFSGYSLKPFAYLLAGLCTGVSLHPIAGHVITEHCMMANDGQVGCGGVGGWVRLDGWSEWVGG